MVGGLSRWQLGGGSDDVRALFFKRGRRCYSGMMGGFGHISLNAARVRFSFCLVFGFFGLITLL